MERETSLGDFLKEALGVGLCVGFAGGLRFGLFEWTVYPQLLQSVLHAAPQYLGAIGAVSDMAGVAAGRAFSGLFKLFCKCICAPNPSEGDVPKPWYLPTIAYFMATIAMAVGQGGFHACFDGVPNAPSDYPIQCQQGNSAFLYLTKFSTLGTVIADAVFGAGLIMFSAWAFQRFCVEPIAVRCERRKSQFSAARAGMFVPSERALEDHKVPLLD